MENRLKHPKQVRIVESTPSSPTTKNLDSSDYLDVSPLPRTRSVRKSSIVFRKSVLLSNGWTLGEQLNLILAKPERSLEDAKTLYDAIKDFPIMSLLGTSSEGKPFDYELVLHLTRHLKFMKIDVGDIVYSQGDASDGMLYIIYEGEIALVVKTADHITKQNQARFEQEQKKRTIVKIGSTRTLRKNNNNKTNPDSQSNRTMEAKKTPRGLEKDDAAPVESEEPVIRDTNEHAFQLLKSYMTTHVIAQKDPINPTDTEIKDDRPVDKDIARMSGVTRAFVKFKKVLKQRNNILNSAKDHGVVRDRLEIGAYFGGTLELGMKKREETAFALKPTELLVIDLKDMQHVKTNLAKKRIALKNFMFDSFPQLDLYQSEKIISGLLSTLEEKSFEAGANIVTEGQAGDYFYILQSGTCEISKECTINEVSTFDQHTPQSRALLRVQPNIKKKIALTSISKGVFFGDELVFQARKYYFTAKVTSSKATCIAINNKTFTARFPHVVYDSLKLLYHIRLNHYIEKIKNHLTSPMFDNYEIVSDFSVLSFGDKKAVLDKMDAKDLCSPISLKPKKNLLQKTLLKGGNGNYPQSPSPAEQSPNSSFVKKEEKQGQKEMQSDSKEKLKNLVEMSAKGGKEKGRAGLALGQNEMKSGSSLPPNLFDFQRELKESMQKSKIFSSTEMAKLKSSGVFEKESKKPFEKGTLDIGNLDFPGRSSSLPGHLQMELLKTGGDTMEDSKKLSSARSKRKMDLFITTSDNSKAMTSEKKEGHFIKGHFGVTLSPLMKVNPRVKMIEISAASLMETPSLKLSPLSFKKPGSNQSQLTSEKGDYELPPMHISASKSQMSAQNIVFRDINPFNIVSPKGTKEYIATKKHLKLKQKMFNDQPVDFQSNFNPIVSPKQHVSQMMEFANEKREMNVQGSLMPNGNISLRSYRLNSSVEALEEVKKKESFKELKKTWVQWPSNQAMMVKEKAHMQRQLKRKGIKNVLV